MERRFKIGERVRIRFRDYDQDDYKFEFTDEMANLSGGEFTIETVENHHGTGHEHEVEDDGFAYYLKEEPANHFTWSSGMLEHAEEIYDKLHEDGKDIKSKIRKILYSSITEDYDKVSTTTSSSIRFDYPIWMDSQDFQPVANRSTRR